MFPNESCVRRSFKVRTRVLLLACPLLASALLGAAGQALAQDGNAASAAQAEIPAADKAGKALSPVPNAPKAGKLDVGSPAPALAPEQWLQGGPIAAFEKDKTYIVEFWGTWCPPCIAAIPHVNELHNKFKDRNLVVIGVAVYEDSPDRAAEFLKKKGEGMAYRVAYDGKKNGSVAGNWLDAAGVKGIPHAFVVRENRILWQGHPTDLTEAFVAGLIEGKVDAEKIRVGDAKQQAEKARLARLWQEFRGFTDAGMAAEAEPVLAELLAISAGRGADESEFIKAEGGIRMARARGDADAASKLIAAFAEKGISAGNLRILQTAREFLMPDGRPIQACDCALALRCVEKTIDLIAQNERVDPLLFVDRARLLVLLGRTDEAIFIMESPEQGGRFRRMAREVLPALKAGQPWPEDHGELAPEPVTPADQEEESEPVSH